jgi:hypothetical protein
VVSVLATTSKAMIATSTSVSVVGSTVSASSPNSIWAMLNSYQLVLWLPLLNSYMSNELLYFIQEFEFASFDMSFMSFKIPWVETSIEELDYPQSEEMLENTGFESGSFVVNQIGFFKLLAFIFYTSSFVLDTISIL